VNPPMMFRAQVIEIGGVRVVGVVAVNLRSFLTTRKLAFRPSVHTFTVKVARPHSSSAVVRITLLTTGNGSNNHRFSPGIFAAFPVKGLAASGIVLVIKTFAGVDRLAFPAIVLQLILCRLPEGKTRVI